MSGQELFAPHREHSNYPVWIPANLCFPNQAMTRPMLSWSIGKSWVQGTVAVGRLFELYLCNILKYGQFTDFCWFVCIWGHLSAQENWQSKIHAQGTKFTDQSCKQILQACLCLLLGVSCTLSASLLGWKQSNLIHRAPRFSASKRTPALRTRCHKHDPCLFSAL